MLRFIDLRGQITDIEECPVEFAFFDTVTDTFCEFGGSVTWKSRKEFLDRLFEEVDEQRFNRFARLVPEWVP